MLKNTGSCSARLPRSSVAGFSLGSLRQGLGPFAHAQAGEARLRAPDLHGAGMAELGELNARFRNNTIRIFNKHGMKSVL